MKSEERFGIVKDEAQKSLRHLPGPGQYLRNLDSLGKSTESLSKKGFGNGFLSKLKRFKEGKDFGYFLQIPGPGAYHSLNL